jgi:hypothetical protein
MSESGQKRKQPSLFKKVLYYLIPLLFLIKVQMIILNRIAELIIKYRNNSISLAERNELTSWVGQCTENFLLFLELIDDEYLHKACTVMFEGDKNANWKKIEQKISQSVPDEVCPDAGYLPKKRYG